MTGVRDQHHGSLSKGAVIYQHTATKNSSGADRRLPPALKTPRSQKIRALGNPTFFIL